MDTNVVALKRTFRNDEGDKVEGTEETYVFLWSTGHRIQTEQTIKRFADDPSLSLTMFEAAMLIQRIRKLDP